MEAFLVILGVTVSGHTTDREVLFLYPTLSHGLLQPIVLASLYGDIDVVTPLQKKVRVQEV